MEKIKDNLCILIVILSIQIIAQFPASQLIKYIAFPRKPCNRPKNRYHNILCLESSRVHLPNNKENQNDNEVCKIQQPIHFIAVILHWLYRIKFFHIDIMNNI